MVPVESSTKMRNIQMTQKPAEISVLALIHYCMHRWRIVLCVGLIVGILAVGYKTYSYYMVKNEEGKTGYESEIEKYEIAKEQYAHAFAAYELSFESLGTSIQALSEEIEYTEKYCQYAPKMLLDPLAYYSASLRVYIKTGYQIMPEMTYQNIDTTPAILREILAELTSVSRKTALAEVCGFDSLYLDDVYSVYSSDGCYINIAFVGPNEEFVDNGVHYILNSLEEIIDSAKKNLGDFDAMLFDDGIALSSSQELIDYQEGKKETLVTSKNDLIEARNRLAKIEEPSKFNEAKPSVKSTAVKFLFIGFLGGMLIAMFWLVLSLLIGDRVISNHNTCDSYGLIYLGSFSTMKYRGLSKVIRKWFNKPDGNEVENDLKLIARNIANYCSDLSGPILITGSKYTDNSSLILEELAKAIPGIEVIVGASLMEDIQTLTDINKCQGVVFVEKVYASKFSDITQELQIVNALGKQILGIAFEE